MAKSFAAAGTKIYIGGAPLASSGVDLTIGDFPSAGEGAITWTEIGGVTNVGSVGDSAEVITSSPLGQQRIRKMKGVRNAGTMELVADLDYADPGQLALIAAEKTQYSYPFKVTFNDAPAGGTPSERYFVAIVFSATEAIEEASNTIRLLSTLEVDSNMVRVAAAEDD